MENFLSVNLGKILEFGATFVSHYVNGEVIFLISMIRNHV